ncbi:hypothetical protein [Streptomyces bambusae]|uniref:Integral membrane protein n=1 Tax=Streptomyces bambusae TaxID=1550616 RepID=A0ABS6ZHJ5_9ACTN|nr:hypothetical protein [Streptomyces bambusae]MBW5487081.1 hypothetical protein [Streptomyces bambusae]
MSSRIRSRGGKSAAGIHTIHIPRQRGRRGAQPFVVIVPERPSLTREALGFLGRTLWKARTALAPTGLALLAFPVTGLLHVLAWWSWLLVAPLAAGPVLWFGVVQRRRPARGHVLAWRIGLASLATIAVAWVALATAFGSLAGPLELFWLLTLIVAQTAWLIVRRSH